MTSPGFLPSGPSDQIRGAVLPVERAQFLNLGRWEAGRGEGGGHSSDAEGP